MPTRHDCSSAQAQRCASKDHFVISDRTQHSRDRYGVCSSGIEEEEETCAAAAEGEAQRGEALCVDISLPASLTPYNPHIHNNYLTYHERRKTAAVRKDMRAAVLAKFEAMIYCRQQEEELGATEKKEDGQVDDASDNHEKAQKIFFLNMVAPGQVDNELSFKVCEECGRYGKVLNVAIIDAHSIQKYVRVGVVLRIKKMQLKQ
ncbi:hypothetical protein HJC23_001811 [Cyclotella cryptica]|uniref:Uncharacterized protein n=1 Tax=Cyclotella cryptica TaxID=29204 RepID=A0ABD3PI74_9STRA